MAEFLDQKQAKQEGKKNLIYSYYNITNNFIVKGSCFIEFHLNSNIDGEYRHKVPNQQSHIFKIRVDNNEKLFSLLTYLVLWSEDTIQIYQILGTTQPEGKKLDTSLQCSQQINGRINSIKAFRRENNVYLIVFLEKKKMITFLYDRQLNCLSCVTQHCFKSQLVNELNATCLERELDDDSVKNHNFQGKIDMNMNELNINEVVGVLISRRILALCFNITSYDQQYKSIVQQAQQNQIQSQLIYAGIPPQFQSLTHPEVKQNKTLFAPQIFYLDLQRKYDANHVIDYAIVTKNKIQNNPEQVLQQQMMAQPYGYNNMQGRPMQKVVYQKVPYIFFINKKIIHQKEQQPISSFISTNLEAPVYDVIKIIQTELIVIQANLLSYAQQQCIQTAQANNGDLNQGQQMNPQMMGYRIDGQQQAPAPQQPVFNDKFDHDKIYFQCKLFINFYFVQNQNICIIQNSSFTFFYYYKHPQFKRLPQNTYLIQALENNLILIMSNYYLYLGTPTTEFHEFSCLAFHHQKYNLDQNTIQNDFIGKIILNEQNIDQEEGLENVQFQQLDSNRILIRDSKKVYIFDISLNQDGQLMSMQIRFIVNFRMHGLCFSARNCLDSGRNDYDIMFMNLKQYSDHFQNSNIYLLTSSEDQMEKKLKMDETFQQNAVKLPPQQYKIKICEKFDNWATIKDITFRDKDRPQISNYYFVTLDTSGKNSIHKCERFINTKRNDMEEIFKTGDYTERIFEIDSNYFIVSCKSGQTKVYEKQQTMIMTSNIANLFLTNISTIYITKGILYEDNEQRPIFIQMGQNQVRVVDINNQTFQDLQIDLNQQPFGFGSLGYEDTSQSNKNQNGKSLVKLVYLCNTIFIMDTDQNLHTFSFYQGGWEKIDYLDNLSNDRYIIGIQKITPYFTSTSAPTADFLFVGFPNEFIIYSAQYNKDNGQIRFQKRYEAYYVKEGLVFLQNGQVHMKKEALKDHLVRSITDPSIKLSYDPRETHNTYVSEYSIQQLQKTLILIIKLNSGDLYIYKGVLKTNIEQVFPYDFQRINLSCMLYFNTKSFNNFPQNFEEMKNNSYQTEKTLYSFHKQQNTIFRNHSIDCVIISDIGKPGFCIAVFENNTQEVFFHIMKLPQTPSVFLSLASFTLTDSENKPVVKGFLIPIEGKINLFSFSMNSKYNSKFIYETPAQLQMYNPLFIDVVRVKTENMKQDDTSPDSFKRYIVLVNQNGNRQEIRLVDEEDHSATTLIKTLPENEKVYKFKTFEGTNKKNNIRFKVQVVGYLTMNIQKDNEDIIESRFYCHYFQYDQMLEMANQCKYQDFIFDFCFLNFPNTIDTNSSEHYKVVLMERDKVMTLNFVKNQITQGKDDGPYHQRLIISSIWNNKQYFLAGDIQKGVQLYEMDEAQSKPRLIGEENININVRQCVLFSIQNKNALRALITDEARNVYAYSFTQQQQDAPADKRKISMELVASFHVGSKINKITTDYKTSDNIMQDAVSHLLLQKQDGNLSVIQLIYEPGENTLLFDLQKTIFEELPYIGGLDSREYRETKQLNQSYKLKNAHSFFETSIVDIYFNLTRPLQERIAAKLNRSRDDFIKMIIDTILS